MIMRRFTTSSSVCKNTQDPHFFKWNKLQERIRYNQLNIECDNPPFNSVSVRELIDDIVNKDRDFQSTTVSRNKIFISYSHEDSQYLEKLKKHLKPMTRNQILEVWDASKIQPGEARVATVFDRYNSPL